ncbi:MAG: non-homologous end-joining DNA ligase [Balneolaceae bacterium]|nr:non-homologous end-joining DNA ligase [Balneolaceae bacterium]
MNRKEDWLESLPMDTRENITEEDFPGWKAPMLATLTDRRFSDDQWIFERKLDGERCLVFRRDDQIHLRSRNQKELDATYPELVEAIGKQQTRQFIADGEIVAFEGTNTSFSRLQKRMHIRQSEEAQASSIAVYYYLFDLLHLDGYTLTQAALRHRKSLLKRVISFQDPLRFVIHRNGEGEAYYEQACKKGWEGVMAKDAQSSYRHSRSRKWLKFKCVNRQDLVIGGYTDPGGERIGFGALLLGYYEDGTLQYAGRVGTGFDNDTLEWLHRKLKKREQLASPFGNSEDIPGDSVHWVKPELVAEIGFEEWTEAGRLRHPRYKGLREDKNAEQVIREER